MGRARNASTKSLLSQGHNTLPPFEASALFLAKAVLVSALIASVLAIQGGMLALHMTAHIVAMNLAAPVFAWLVKNRTGWPAGSSLRSVCIAALAQLMVFFLWHSPLLMELSMHSAGLRLAMLAVLFCVSTWFWGHVLEAISQNRLETIAVLLVTGKLVCLVAVLLVFAPRLIYPGMAMHVGALDDQHLAGLLMLSACPLTYVGASIYIVARWFKNLSSSPA